MPGRGTQGGAAGARRSTLTNEEGWTFAIVKAEDLYEHPEHLLARLVAEMHEHGIPVPDILSDDWRQHFRITTAAA